VGTQGKALAKPCKRKTRGGRLRGGTRFGPSFGGKNRCTTPEEVPAQGGVHPKKPPPEAGPSKNPQVFSTRPPPPSQKKRKIFVTPKTRDPLIQRVEAGKRLTKPNPRKKGSPR